MHVLPPDGSSHAPPQRYVYRFQSSLPETPTTSTFRFVPEGPPLPYRSNQAIRLILGGNDARDRLVHTFSLSSSPTEADHIAITVRMTGSRYKEALRALRPGDRVELVGPIGDLLYDPRRPALFIAGGVGIAPLRGMLRFAVDSSVQQPITLLYSARTPDEFAFRREIESISRTHPNVRVRLTVTRPTPATLWPGRTGRIDEPWIREALTELAEPKAYVVGRPELVEGVLHLLRRRLSVPETDLEYEHFVGYGGTP